MRKIYQRSDWTTSVLDGFSFRSDGSHASGSAGHTKEVTGEMVLGFVLFLLLVTSSFGKSELTSKQGVDTCTTPYGEAGDCRNLNNCSILAEVVRQNQPSDILLVKESICGFEGTDSLVCCPVPSQTRSPQEAPTQVGEVTTLGYRENEATEEQCGQVSFQVDRIVDGDDAVLGEWPWLAALGYWSFRGAKVQWRCGGSLVTRRHIVTAAHCVNTLSDKTQLVVRLGELNLEDNIADGATPVDVEIDKMFPHPNFTSHPNVNDIAIVRLKSAVPLSENIRPICLPNSSYFKSSSLAGEIIKVAGWGALSFGGLKSKKLQQVELKITDEETCRNAYHSLEGVVIDDRIMCIGNPGKGPCQGDSGGSLTLVQNLTYYLVGVHSFGVRCGEPEFPGVATRVSSFLEWITSNLN